VAPKGGRSSIQVGAKRSGCFVRQSPPLDEPADLDDDVLAEQSAMKKRFQVKLTPGAGLIMARALQ
jgi:hypothetical protein